MDKNRSDADQGNPSTDWSNVMQENLQPLLNAWTTLFFPSSGDQDMELNSGRAAESLQALVKMGQSMTAAMSETSACEQFQKATAQTPRIVLGYTRTCLQSFTNLQSRTSEWIRKRGAALSAADIQELDSEVIKDLIQNYEKEFSRYLKVPQIGLSRLQQERILNAIDKQISFQLILSEFLHVLYLPIEKSLQNLVEKMAEMAETGKIDEKSKTYYNLWIKLLEGQYMELFKQSSYRDQLNKTLGALNECVGARQALINDLLKQMNIPSYCDLDEMSKEIYLLKKRVRGLENQEQGALDS